MLRPRAAQPGATTGRPDRAPARSRRPAVAAPCAPARRGVTNTRLGGSLEVAVPARGTVEADSRAVHEPEDEDVEGDERHLLEEGVHRLNRRDRIRSRLDRHGRGREDGVGAGRRRSRGVSRDDRQPRAAVLGSSGDMVDVSDLPRSADCQQKVSRPDPGSRVVPHPVRVGPRMHEPHPQSARDEALTPDADDRDRASCQERTDQRDDPLGAHPLEGSRDLARHGASSFDKARHPRSPFARSRRSPGP